MVVQNKTRNIASSLNISSFAASSGKGFTLLELIIVLAIVAILATIAAPSFNASIKRSTLNAAQEALSHTLNVARNEALVRKVQTVVCASGSGSGCDANNDWSQGWIVFADNNADGNFSRGNDVLIHVQDGYRNVSIEVSGGSHLAYAVSGTLAVRVQRRIEICPADNDANLPGRRMTVASTGSVRNEDNAEC